MTADLTRGNLEYVDALPYDAANALKGKRGITVIDQHALHERIMYEHLRERVLSGAVESQPVRIQFAAAIQSVTDFQP